jgi:hypothetical protein
MFYTHMCSNWCFLLIGKAPMQFPPGKRGGTNLLEHKAFVPTAFRVLFCNVLPVCLFTKVSWKRMC